MNIARIIAQRGPSDIIACDCTTPVSEVVRTLAARRIGALPVMRDGKVVGIAGPVIDVAPNETVVAIAGPYRYDSRENGSTPRRRYPACLTISKA